jgi:hypothetical protein
MADRCGLDISRCRSWGHYTDYVVSENNRSSGGFIKRVNKEAGCLSTGEVPLLQAMLHAADFSRSADGLSKTTWATLDRTYGDHAKAVALAILRQ